MSTIDSSPFLLRVAVVGSHDPAALQHVVATLPSRSGLAVVIAAPIHDGLLDKLRAASKLPVTDVRETVRIEPDRLFVIPPELDGWIHDGQLHVQPGADPRAPVDRLMRSVADQLGRDGAGVVLAGRGSDGLIGIKLIKEAGGITIAQLTDDTDQEMPRAAIDTGLIDLVLPADQIAGRLVALAHDDRDRLTIPDATDTRADEQLTEILRDILTLVRVRSGHDFSSYKRATLFRRVARRMQVCQTESISEYRSYLREHPGELGHLLRDFLISVTNFFRDPDAFIALERLALPKLFANKTATDPLRVWVPGCATGEEAYSIAILLEEHARYTSKPPHIQIFATDIDEHALKIARAGHYPETIAVDVSADRLSSFFVPENHGYTVTKELRERILFSPHNLLRDPPFSRLDLITCRNLLIYFNRDAQDRVLSVFHFALRNDGFLFLGSSESAESTSLFTSLDPKQRVFSRRLTSTPAGFDPVGAASRWLPAKVVVPGQPAERAAPPGEIHKHVVEQFAPPSVLVNDELDVMHVSENAAKFLEVTGGEPTRQILRLVHPGLRLELRTALYAARQRPGTIETRVARIDNDGTQRTIELRVRMLEMPELARGSMLVMFDELQPTQRAVATEGLASLEPVVREMEDELRRTRDQLRSTIEQYETSVEELKASNEELQAINEELRSATEELETGKEELQSMNEELTTLNHELKIKVDELSRANSDLQNLMTSTDIGVVFLDRALHIKRFTPRVQELLNVIASDVGRPLAHVTHKLPGIDLVEIATTIMSSLRTIEREVKSIDGHRYLARFLPYRSLDDRIEGVVLTFVEVTDLRDAVDARRRSEVALATLQERLRFALKDAPIIALSLDEAAKVTWGYAFGAELPEGAGTLLGMLAPGHLEQFTATSRESIATQTSRRTEVDILVGGELRTYDFRIEPRLAGAHAVGFDITPSKIAEVSLREADRRKDEFLATLSHELRNPLTPLKVALDVARLTDDPEQQRQSRGIMERQVEQLGKLVDDLLDLSRITQGRVTLDRKTIPSAEIVEAALETIRPQIMQRRHELHVSLPETSVEILGDRSRLIQVLTNLLSNAAKYTPDGGRIDLIVAADRLRRKLQITVRDTGIGIPKDMLRRVFEIFVQCRDEHGRSQGGLGIGLNIVRRLVELHGGTVSARSEGEGRGSEFVIELPLVSP